MQRRRTQHRWSLLSTAIVAGVIAACGTSAGGPAAGDGGVSCEDLQKSARSEVLAAFEGHAQCTADADCVSIGFSAKCFDSCSRSLNKSFTSDLTAAKDRVNNAQCKQFEAQGCKLIIPPCSPPNPPACKANVCQE